MTAKYHVTLRILHWVMALLILGMIAMGWYMTGLEKENPLRGTLVGLHKSFGALLLGLFFVRVVARFATKIPPLPGTIPAHEQKVAHLGHGSLYLLLGIVPLSGYAMSNLYGYGVSMFGLSLPRFFPENKALAALAREAHEILPYVLLALIALHFLAVIKHRFFDRPENDVLGRML